VQDQFNNPVGAGAITVIATPSAGPASNNTATPNANGAATFAGLTLTQAGRGTLTFTAANFHSWPSTQIVFSPGPLGPLQILAGNNQSDTVLANLPIRPSVRGVDASLNGVPGVVVTFTPANSSSGTVTPTTVTTDASGTATVTSTNVPINPALPRVFFRLRHP